MPRTALWLWTLVCGLAAGCGKSPERSEIGTGAGAGPVPKHVHSTTGLVREIAVDRRTAVIRHEEIPGYMPRMTMELNLRDTNELAGIGPGDTIAFRLSATDETHWIDQVRRLAGAPTPAVAGEARTPMPVTVPVPAGKSIALKPGDPMPEARLTDEHGRGFPMSEFLGRAIAFTFFFTRCPLPDFCPRMNQNLAEARRLLLADPTAPTNWGLLSISFDPEFDRPAVLRSHAPFYRGDDTNHWLFAVADAETLRQLAPRLDLRMTREAGSISHNLRTVVLDTRGRIHRQFDGNRWTAAELTAAVSEAAQVR